MVDPRGITCMYPIRCSRRFGLQSHCHGDAFGSGGRHHSNSTDTDPVAIIVDPALGRFVFTANYLGNSISGFRLSPNTGALKTTQATPYPTGANPTAMIAIPHGNHASQTVTP